MEIEEMKTTSTKAPRWQRLGLFGVVFAITLAVLFAACGSSAQPSKATANNAVRGSVQHIVVAGQERTYVCFAYTTSDRGGLWCERVTK